MKDLKNHSYFHKVCLCGLVLCASLGATAQGMDAAEKPIQQRVVPAAEVVINEALKTEADKAEEAKNQDPVEKGSLGKRIIGLASFYATKFHGKHTASGEKFSSKLLTAAHLTLPFGTRLKVTNPHNQQSVIVRVNDRGPHARGRLLDLSRAAADRLGITRRGVARVEIEVLKP